jgi:monothiol glutaredoxin
MPRSLLDQDHIHPAIRAAIADSHADIVAEVKAALACNAIVIVGMRFNPFPRKARHALDALGTPYKYLSYGGYFGGWKRRTALKMWTGWSTFPMIFVHGTLIGGAAELNELIASGELASMLVR